MPDYTVKDSQTGKTITFRWNGDQPPTDADFEQVFAEARGITQEPASATSRFLGSVGDVLNPMNAVNLAAGLVNQPKETVNAALFQPMAEQGQQAADAFRQGRPLASLGHAFGMVPFIGPTAVHGVEQAQSGDVAGGLGTLTGMVAPFLAVPVLKTGLATAGKVAPSLAEAAQASATNRLVDVMAPKVGPQKTRFGVLARKIAPELLQNTSALTRGGLRSQVSEGLDAATAALDVAAEARGPSAQVKTGPLLAKLNDIIDGLQAKPVEASRTIREAIGPAERVTPIDPTKLYALRWMKEDMESLPFVKRTVNDIPRGAGGGKDVVSGAAGAPIYRAIVGAEDQPLISASRADVVRAIDDLIAGREGTGRLHELINGVADQLAQGNPRIQKLMATGGPNADQPSFYRREVGSNQPTEPAPLSAAPLGQTVEPTPNSDQITALRQIQREIAALGPVAPYESIRRIRQAWDQVAQVKYMPATAQDALKSRGEATAAMQGAGAMRDALAEADPGTAAANAQYHLFKAADDVMTAADQAEQVRPKVGRTMFARGTGAIAGEAMGGIKGATVGSLVGPLIERTMSSLEPAKQLVVARLLTQLADALRGGHVERSASLWSKVLGQLPPVTTGLKIAPTAGRLAAERMPALADSGDANR